MNLKLNTSDLTISFFQTHCSTYRIVSFIFIYWESNLVEARAPVSVTQIHIYIYINIKTKYYIFVYYNNNYCLGSLANMIFSYLAYSGSATSTELLIFARSKSTDVTPRRLADFFAGHRPINEPVEVPTESVGHIVRGEVDEGVTTSRLHCHEFVSIGRLIKPRV